MLQVLSKQQSKVLLLIFIYFPKNMDKQSKWLDIEGFLYPQTTLTKRIIIQNPADGFFQELYAQVTYHSQNREIDITDTIVQSISKAYPYEVGFEVLYYDQAAQKFILIGQYPFEDQCVYLGEEFINQELITIRIQRKDQEKSEMKQNSTRRSKQRTIKQVLQKLAEWRRIHFESSKKISLEEAARMIGIPKRTLNDYYSQVGLAQKYGFNFENNLHAGMGVLRRFVRQNHEKKKQQPSLKILQLFGHKKQE